MTNLPRFEDFYAAHPELFDTGPASRVAVDEANARAVQLGLTAPPPVPPPEAGPPPVVSHAARQTPLKNQDTRGTCYAFATVAAMEAAYHRQYGLTLDLSEQYAFHLNKITELLDTYVTSPNLHESNSSMWGFQGSSDLVDKLSRAAIPDEAACPYLTGAQMQQLLASIPAAGALPLAGTTTQEQIDAFDFAEGHVPTAARYGARYRIKAFAALPARPSTRAIEEVLAAGYEVVADIPGHCVLIVGYDRNQGQFTIKDSANPASLQTLAYNSTTVPILAGRYITKVEPPDEPQKDAWWLGRWRMDHDGWRGELVIRRTTNFRRPAPGLPTKLGTYYDSGGVGRDVNGELVQGGLGLHCWIADTPRRVEPGTRAGQEFWVYAFSFDPTNAAGRTVWNGVPFGVSLSRGALSGAPSETFDTWDWVGTWHLNHDGHRGMLHIDNVFPPTGRYVDQDGRVFLVNGTHGEHPHIVHLTVHGLQDFDLYAHSRERDVASGTTTWNGLTFGVQAHRAGSPVDSGEQPAPEPAVPDVVGLPHLDAANTLRSYGYPVQTQWEWTSTGIEEGYVSGQHPGGGAPDLPPTPVTIWVRTLPPEPTEPYEPATRLLE